MNCKNCGELLEEGVAVCPNCGESCEAAEELTERFVRGDASRHSEGSGLGLAIADSLCRVQGGALSLTVDGDLFKAVVTFAAADEGIQSS